ncbi:hypothetical protein DUI87_17682 [Hirundo rustica rustica]|uniref:Uncharacterized protein n=1 Tax=Hirundo rustica rustica TaxID=333673 RepID=A0A3M0KEI8_HIRRU|nr:hypothetical protein DUI87_17682 [Hirundo rustica rustica]
MKYITMALNVCMLLECIGVDAWLVAQLKENVWVTLAKTLQQENICLSMGSMDNPLATCLVEILLKPNNHPFAGKNPNPVDLWDERTKILPHATEEPQELELLGFSLATYCIQFSYKRITYSPKNLFMQKMSLPHRKFIWPITSAITPQSHCPSPLKIPKFCREECS